MTFGIPIETLPEAIGGDRLPRMPPTTASSNAAETTTDNGPVSPVPDLGTPPTDSGPRAHGAAAAPAGQDSVEPAQAAAVAADRAMQAAETAVASAVAAMIHTDS